MFVQIFLKSGNVNCTDSQFCSGFLYKKLMALLTWGIIFAVMVCRSYFRCALPMHYLRCIYSCIAVVESTTTTYVVVNTYQTLPAPPLESTVIIKQTFIIKLWLFLAIFSCLCTATKGLFQLTGSHSTQIVSRNTIIEKNSTT